MYFEGATVGVTEEGNKPKMWGNETQTVRVVFYTREG